MCLVFCSYWYIHLKWISLFYCVWFCLWYCLAPTAFFNDWFWFLIACWDYLWKMRIRHHPRVSWENSLEAVALLCKLWKSDLARRWCVFNWSGTFRWICQSGFLNECERCASSTNSLHLPVETTAGTCRPCCLRGHLLWGSDVSWLSACRCVCWVTWVSEGGIHPPKMSLCRL